MSIYIREWPFCKHERAKRTEAITCELSCKQQHTGNGKLDRPILKALPARKHINNLINSLQQCVHASGAFNRAWSSPRSRIAKQPNTRASKQAKAVLWQYEPQPAKGHTYSQKESPNWPRYASVTRQLSARSNHDFYKSLSPFSPSPRPRLHIVPNTLAKKLAQQTLFSFTQRFDLAPNHLFQYKRLHLREPPCLFDSRPRGRTEIVSSVNIDQTWLGGRTPARGRKEGRKGGLARSLFLWGEGRKKNEGEPDSGSLVVSADDLQGRWCAQNKSQLWTASI